MEDSCSYGVKKASTPVRTSSTSAGRDGFFTNTLPRSGASAARRELHSNSQHNAFTCERSEPNSERSERRAEMRIILIWLPANGDGPYWQPSPRVAVTERLALRYVREARPVRQSRCNLGSASSQRRRECPGSGQAAKRDCGRAVAGRGVR